VKAGAPGARIVFVSIKPSVQRWSKWPEMQKANALVKEFTEGTAGTVFVDVTREMLGADGKPRAELFRADGLHMNAKGYEIWNTKLRPVVEQRQGDANGAGNSSG
jgi:lysophospholipase L1-like esterase